MNTTPVQPRSESFPSPDLSLGGGNGGGVMIAMVERIRAFLAKVIIRRVSRRLPFRLVVHGDPERIGEAAASGPGIPAMRLHRPDSFYRRLGTDGLIGFGEAFQAGDWDSDDLAGLLTVFASDLDAFVPRPLQRIRGHRAAPRRPRVELETVDGARRNSRLHYDLPTAMFRAFLDETMTYSSALFLADDDGYPIARDELLVEAQHRKIDRILDTIGVGPSTRLLEIGTGWGELAIRAASRGAFVDSITNSAEQAALSAERIDKADLADYRELENGSRSYDAIVSVEMIEAVGERYWPDYFGLLGRLLEPHGRVGLQAITMKHDRMMQAKNTYTWIHKHIFPGGLIPSVISIEQNVMDHTNLHILDSFSFGNHYAATLRLWRARFAQHWSSLMQLGFDETFRRSWEFYLAYCEAGFASGYLDVYQLLLGN